MQRSPRLAALALLLLAAGLLPPSGAALAQAAAQPPSAVGATAEPEASPRPAPMPPQAFHSPEAGFAALAEAMAAYDERRLLRVLGTEGRRLIRSGDPVADRNGRDAFARAYAARHEILRPAPGRAMLQVGEDGWPLPIPMVAGAGGATWRFDARQGAQALVDMRVGRNELDTIATLRAIAEAQDDYARTVGSQGGLRSYARRFFSTPGTRDGLYWPPDAGEAESPLGPLIAAASIGGYALPSAGTAEARRAAGEPRPFHGYLYRILEGQGPAAPGGAMDWLVGDRLIGGFAVLAVPARWGESGRASFMVSHHGTVWEANLGPDTARIARGITRFDPGPGWRRVAE